MSFLDRIRPAKEAEARALADGFAAGPTGRPDHMPIRDFAGALRSGGGVIAEIKRTSPSRPDLERRGPVGALARAYRRGGARALSIVTDATHFGTSLDDVAELKAAVDLPVLTKDFVIHPAQITAAWAAGADAVLLIVRMLDDAALTSLLIEARGLGLTVLVECHSAAEIVRAVAAGADPVGVNNRNLQTLTTDLVHGEELLPLVPDHLIRVSESGLDSRGDLERMATAGADAFLIGHGLLLSRDPGRKVAELTGRERENARRVKICGLASVEDARDAHTAGAHLLGLVFADSPRRVDVTTARAIRATVPGARLCGVFLDEDPDTVVRIAAECELDLVQLHGHESPDACAAVADRSGLPVIKALRPDEVTPMTIERYEAAAYFLVDRTKGDGVTAPEDLQEAAKTIRKLGRDVFLAGGLNPDNVAGRVASSDPFGVDVASGVESAPGRKDIEAVKAFIREATS